MPKPGKRWRHVVLSTHNSWLPGDPRGFRSKDHEIRSSGDYKHPPPPGEHAALFRYNKDRGGKAVVIPNECRERVGRAIVEKLEKLDHQILAVAVAVTHLHGLIELPDDMKQIRHILGQCKSKASHAIRDVLPGRVFAFGQSAKPVDSREYRLRVYNYILRQNNAWIWSYRDAGS